MIEVKRQKTGGFAIYDLLIIIDYFSLASVLSVAQTTVLIGVNLWPLPLIIHSTLLRTGLRFMIYDFFFSSA